MPDATDARVPDAETFHALGRGEAVAVELAVELAVDPTPVGGVPDWHATALSSELRPSSSQQRSPRLKRRYIVGGATLR